MKNPHYVDLDEARKVLSELGVEFNSRQMKRATDMDGEGKRKLPFFIDPIDHRLKIEKETLINIYLKRQMEAERNCRLTP
jgi:hypothetical protein